MKWRIIRKWNEFVRISGRLKFLIGWSLQSKIKTKQNAKETTIYSFLNCLRTYDHIYFPETITKKKAKRQTTQQKQHQNKEHL